MRDSGLADPDQRRDVADAKLAGGKRIQDAYARWIAKDAKRVGQRFDGARRHQCGLPQVREMGGIAFCREIGGRNGGHMNI